jgi:GNAT superfamily N-acetyltransferase
MTAFTRAAVEHYGEAHSEWGLSETAIINWLDAKDRLSGQVERLDGLGEVEVHQVSRDRIEDVLSFFDHDGFAGNPEWASCYCMFFHREDPDSNGNQPWRQNREGLKSSLEAGTTIGYLAYIDGRPGGWCNASLRSAYPTRRTGESDDEVGVVTCFVIAPPYRRHGLAQKLLDAALEGFRSRGVKRVEAHPPAEATADPQNFQGPLSLYIGAGFTEVARHERNVLVAKELT